MANEKFNRVKDYIVYKVVNHDSNIGLLTGVPHVNYLDLAIIFYRIMPETVDLEEKEVVLIGNEELFLWDVTVEDLMNAAGANTSRILGVKIRGILSTIAEYLDDTVSEWSDITGIAYWKIIQRHRVGLPLEQVFFNGDLRLRQTV